MSDQSAVARVPRRDADGRVVSLPQLVGVAAGFAVVNGVGLLLVDGLLALLGLSDFGRSSGWLVVILPALLYFDDFRGWRAYRRRWLAAPVAALFAFALGLLAAGLARALPPLASGTIGAFVAVLVYAPVWFVGVRALTGAGPADTSVPSRDRRERR